MKQENNIKTIGYRYRRMLILLLLFVTSTSIGAQDFVLHGKVFDDDNNPVELATVSCLGQGKVTMTNMKGEYTLTLSSADSVVVRFSMIGYKAKERVLRKPKGRQSLQIVLYEDDNTLQDLTVTERRRQTSTTEELDIKDIKNAPSASGKAV